MYTVKRINKTIENISFTTSAGLPNIWWLYLLSLVDIEAVIFKFLLQNIGDADVNMDDLLLTFPFNVNVWLNPLKGARYELSGKFSTQTKSM